MDDTRKTTTLRLNAERELMLDFLIAAGFSSTRHGAALAAIDYTYCAVRRAIATKTVTAQP